MKTKSSLPLSLIMLILLSFSIAVTYYSKIITKDYEIIYTDSGLPVLDDE